VVAAHGSGSGGSDTPDKQILPAKGLQILLLALILSCWFFLKGLINEV
jgi:hypothetical protein